jgi:hypothetical protein
VLRNSSTPAATNGRPIRCCNCKKLGHSQDQCTQIAVNSPVTSIPKQRVGNAIPEIGPNTAGEPVYSSRFVGASGHELLLQVEVEGQHNQFLIDSGTSLSIVMPGVDQAEVNPTNTAPRGITGTKLKSLGSQRIGIKLGNRVYSHEYVVTPLDVEYSGLLGVDNLRLTLKRPNQRAETLQNYKARLLVLKLRIL